MNHHPLLNLIVFTPPRVKLPKKGKIEKEKEYLLYCKKEIMSQLHVQYLRDTEDAENIRVYRP